MEGQMHLSGQLRDWSVSDLLQIMQVTKKTGSLDLNGERQARIHFSNGFVTGAELKDASGSRRGADSGSIADVLLVISTLVEGTFSVGPADGPDMEGWSVEEVLADVDALESLQNEVFEAGLIEARSLQLVSRIEQPLEVTTADWGMLSPLVAPFTFDGLEARLGRGAAVRVLSLLHRLGVVEATESDTQAEDDVDEAEWLDRLADGIAPESSDPTWRESADGDDEPIPVGVAEGEVEIAIPEQDQLLSRPGAHDGADVQGVSAPASTILTDGVYDEIRRLRSKVSEG